MEENSNPPRSFELPQPSDVLFNAFNSNFHHNAQIQTGISKFFLFSDSYKIAAQKLFEQLDGDAWNANSLVYPLVFLSRHFLELRLKELVTGLNYAKNGERKFSNGHSLKFLWNEFISLLPEMGESLQPDPVVKVSVEKLILEFNDIDPNSMSFRYPVDRTPERNGSVQMDSLDLENFRIVMDKLFNFFDTQTDVVFYLEEMADEFFSQMRDAYHQEMSSYYY